MRRFVCPIKRTDKKCHKSDRPILLKDVHVPLRIHNSNNIPSIQLNLRLSMNYGLRVSDQNFRI